MITYNIWIESFDLITVGFIPINWVVFKIIIEFAGAYYEWPKIVTLLVPYIHVVNCGLRLSSCLVIEFAGATVATPSDMRRYNYIDDALRSWIIHFILNKGLSSAHTSDCYCYSYKTIKSITKAFEKNGQVAPKHKGNVHYPILQDEHIQWSVDRPHEYPYINVESLHCQMNQDFQIICPASINIVSKAVRCWGKFIFKLMHYKPYEWQKSHFISMMTYKQSVQTRCKVEQERGQ